MENKEKFVAYEYKSITVKRDAATLYTDCLRNFGWAPTEEQAHGFHTAQLGTDIAAGVTAFAAQAAPDAPDAMDMVTLRFKRDRRLQNKREIEKLERECEASLQAIDKLEKKSSARTMGISLGLGLVSTVFVGLSVRQFFAANIVLGVLFALIGLAGWGIGFVANRKVGKKQSANTDPLIEAQMDTVYNACEKAHDLLSVA